MRVRGRRDGGREGDGIGGIGAGSWAQARTPRYPTHHPTHCVFVRPQRGWAAAPPGKLCVGLGKRGCFFLGFCDQPEIIDVGCVDDRTTLGGQKTFQHKGCVAPFSRRLVITSVSRLDLDMM